MLVFNMIPLTAEQEQLVTEKCWEVLRKAQGFIDGADGEKATRYLHAYERLSDCLRVRGGWRDRSN